MDKKQYDREKYLENKEKILKQVTLWSKNNKDKRKIYSARYWHKNKKRIGPKHKKSYHDCFVRLRLKVLDLYGNKCQCCGETIKEFLCIDHINNDGYKQRKEHGAGYMFLKWIKENVPRDLQILCHNCNAAKQIYGICPHSRINNAG